MPERADAAADLDMQEPPESPAMAWAHWLQAELGAYEGICIQQRRVATPSGEVVGRCQRWISFRPRQSHPASSSVGRVLAFEGGHEAAVPIPAAGDLDLLTETSWGCKFFGLGCLSPSLLLKPFQLPRTGRDNTSWGALCVLPCRV